MTESSSATPKRKNGPVDYEVYRVGQQVLHFVGPATAVNDVKAIELALGEQPVEGQYIAIPTRSLRVREVRPEMTVKVVIA